MCHPLGKLKREPSAQEIVHQVQAMRDVDADGRRESKHQHAIAKGWIPPPGQGASSSSTVPPAGDRYQWDASSRTYVDRHAGVWGDQRQQEREYEKVNMSIGVIRKLLTPLGCHPTCIVTKRAPASAQAARGKNTASRIGWIGAGKK